MANYWIQRDRWYQRGVFLLAFSTLLYIVGFSSPYWQYSSYDSGYDSVEAHAGLWQRCISQPSGTQCFGIHMDASPGWFKATIAMQIIGLIFLLLSFAYFFFANCFANSQTHTRALEAMAMGAGGCGFIGAMVYVGKMEELYSGLGVSTSYKPDYSWSFALNIAGCILSVGAGLIIAKGNNPSPPAATTFGGVVSHPHGAVIVMQGQGYGYQPHMGPPAYTAGPYPPGTQFSAPMPMTTTTTTTTTPTPSAPVYPGQQPPPTWQPPKAGVN